MEWLKRNYLDVDPRTLGLTRVLLALLLLLDLAKRAAGISLWYTNDGLLPNHRLLWRPLREWSVSYLFALTSVEEVAVAFAITALIYLAFLVGYRTRLMHVLSWFSVISLQARIGWLTNGGDYVLCILMLWTMLLPMGRRFSVDAIRASLRARREHTLDALRETAALPRDSTPVTSLVVLACMAQLSVIYLFNALHKGGATWIDGTAVYWLLHQARIVTSLGVWLRNHAPLELFRGLSYATLVVEYALPALILSPWGSPWTRRLALVCVWGLHGSIAAVSNLGIFSPVMMTFASLLVRPEDWRWVDQLGRRRSKLRRTLIFDTRSAACWTVARLLVRLDGFGRLALEDGREAALANDAERALEQHGWLVKDADGRAWWGPAGARELLRALPLGGLWVWLALPLWPLAAWCLRNRNGIAASLGWAAPEPARGVEISPPPPPLRRRVARYATGLQQGLAVALMVVTTSQVLVDNQAVPKALKHEQPRWLRATVSYLRLNQGWTMFAPEAPRNDMTVVVDAVTQDGRHVDPYNETSSQVADPSARVVPERLGHNQYWCDYTLRIPHRGLYHDLLADWVLNYHRRTGRPEDKIVAFDAYMVEQDRPPPGGDPRAANTRVHKFLSKTVETAQR